MKLTALPRALALAGALAAAGSAAAIAEETYALSGNHADRGGFSTRLVLDGDDAQLTLRFTTGEVVATGSVAPPAGGDRWPLQGQLRITQGLAGTLIDAQSAIAVELYAAAPDSVVLFFWDRQSDAWTRATGRRVDAGDDEDDDDLGDAIRRGDLLVYTKREVRRLAGRGVREALESGFDLGTTLKLTDFFHIGLDAGTEMLEADELTPEQIEAVAHQPHPHVWFSTEVEGGVRLPFRASIPLGAYGNVGVGLEPGAELTYEVVDLYRVPDGFGDASGFYQEFKRMGRRVFDLPLTADEAADMTLGASRSLEGQMTLAVSGSLGVGYDTTEFNDVVEVGASARVGGFYRLRRNFRMAATRLRGDTVRLQVTDGRSKGPGASARLFLGAGLNEDEVSEELAPSAEYLQPVVDVAVDGADSVVKKVLRFRLRGNVSRTDEDEVDIAYRFDLSEPTARRAYERTVRGDLTHAAYLSTRAGSGVEREFRVLEAERRVYQGAELDISVIVEGNVREDVAATDLLVEDAAGNNLYSVYRFHRTRRLGLLSFLGSLGGRKWDERIFVELIRHVDADEAADRIAGGNLPADAELNAGSLPYWLSRRAFRFRYDLRDPITRKSEGERLRDVLAALGLDGAAGLPVPERRLFRSRYGKTRTHLSVDVAEPGVRFLMGRLNQEEAFRDAFLDAYEEIGEGERDSSKARRKADRFIEHLNGVKFSNSTDERAEHLEELFEDSGWDLTMITAIVKIVPRSTVRIFASIDGKRIAFTHHEAGERYEEFLPNLHGHAGH